MGYPLIIVADTSILINFLRINRMDLIASYSHDFLITDHVHEEITDHYPIQQRMLKQAVDRNILVIKRLDAQQEIELFANLMHSGRIGSGECSAISCAIGGSHILALDDKRAIKEARKIAPEIKIMKTQDLMLSMIEEKLITVNEADDIKHKWAMDYKFKLKINSFQELIDCGYCDIGER